MINFNTNRSRTPFLYPLLTHFPQQFGIREKEFYLSFKSFVQSTYYLFSLLISFIESGDLSLPFSVLPGTNPVVTSTPATAGGVLDTPQVVLADKRSPPFAFPSGLNPDDPKRLKTSI